MKNLFVSMSLLIALSISGTVNAYEDYVVTVKATDMKFYVHTDHHVTEKIKNISTLYVNNANTLLEPSTQNVCDSGLWINNETNPAAYSMILAAVISKSDINIAYTTEPGPWGSPNYCAIMRVSIN